MEKFEEAIAEYATVLKQEKERRKAIEIAAGPFSLINRQKGKSHSYDVQLQFVFQRQLGRGSFSRVDEVKETSTGHLYACKRIHMDTGSQTLSYELERVAEEEVAIMRKLQHQHIASVLFALKDTDNYSIFMLPVADCNLRRYMEQCIYADYPTAMVDPLFRWFGCLLNGLNHAHKKMIKHRDIKPSNILIKDKEPYLTDFGLAKDFSEHDSSFSENTFVEGTPQYFAPEHQPGERHGRSADIFALGCVFSEMMTVGNKKSLEEYKSWRRVPQATHGPFAFRDNLPKVQEWLHRIEKGDLNDVLVHQALGMLHQDPENRPTAQEGLNTLHRQRALFCME